MNITTLDTRQWFNCYNWRWNIISSQLVSTPTVEWLYYHIPDVIISLAIFYCKCFISLDKWYALEERRLKFNTTTLGTWHQLQWLVVTHNNVLLSGCWDDSRWGRAVSWLVHIWQLHWLDGGCGSNIVWAPRSSKHSKTTNTNTTNKHSKLII